MSALAFVAILAVILTAAWLACVIADGESCMTHIFREKD